MPLFSMSELKEHREKIVNNPEVLKDVMSRSGAMSDADVALFKNYDLGSVIAEMLERYGLPPITYQQIGTILSAINTLKAELAQMMLLMAPEVAERIEASKLCEERELAEDGEKPLKPSWAGRN